MLDNQGSGGWLLFTKPRWPESQTQTHQDSKVKTWLYLASSCSPFLINSIFLTPYSLYGWKGVSQGNQSKDSIGKMGWEKKSRGGKRWVQEGNEVGVNNAVEDQGLKCWDAARLENFNLLSLLAPFEVYGSIYTHSINHMKQGGDL